jgi:hypothetical protein
LKNLTRCFANSTLSLMIWPSLDPDKLFRDDMDELMADAAAARAEVLIYGDFNEKWNQAIPGAWRNRPMTHGGGHSPPTSGIACRRDATSLPASPESDRSPTNRASEQLKEAAGDRKMRIMFWQQDGSATPEEGLAHAEALGADGVVQPGFTRFTS